MKRTAEILFNSVATIQLILALTGKRFGDMLVSYVTLRSLRENLMQVRVKTFIRVLLCLAVEGSSLLV